MKPYVLIWDRSMHYIVTSCVSTFFFSWERIESDFLEHFKVVHKYLIFKVSFQLDHENRLDQTFEADMDGPKVILLCMRMIRGMRLLIVDI